MIYTLIKFVIYADCVYYLVVNVWLWRQVNYCVCSRGEFFFFEGLQK